MLISLSLFHLIWTRGFAYIEPVPFRCMSGAYIGFVVLQIRCWHNFPKELKENDVSKKQCRAFIYFLIWSNIVSIQLLIITKLFKEIPMDIQWILGMVVPLIKEINDRIVQ